MPPAHAKPQGEGLTAWARLWARPLGAELLGTALLLALGLGSTLPTPASLIYPAVGFGGAVAGLAHALGGISGAHLNPAVTLGALLLRRLPAAAAAAYALAQLLGALLGTWLLLAVAPGVTATTFVTAPAADVGVVAAIGVEALLTGSLVLACAACWARPEPGAAALMGLLVAGLVCAGGALTGASLNPARSLAPALLQGQWANHWVYWVGPLGGAALAAGARRALESPAAATPGLVEELPLRRKPDLEPEPEPETA